MRTVNRIGGRYRLLESSGRGGMADVFVAEDERLGRRVAVKVMADRLLGDAGSFERFRREAQAVAALNHPNVVALYDAASEGDRHYLVLELVEGPTLADRIEHEGALAPLEAVRIIDQVASGLSAAHARGMVHLDVKPANILFTTDGVAKIADFGIARMLEASTTITTTIRGSASYIAPEHALTGEADARCDVYSLGCVLFEALTGRPPFLGQTQAVLVGQHLHATAPDVHDLRADLPPALGDVLTRMLARDPDERARDMDEVRDLLRPLLVDVRESTRDLGERTQVVTPLARSGQRPAHALRAPGRRVGAWAAGLALVLGGSAALGALATDGATARPGRDLLAARPEAPEPEPEPDVQPEVETVVDAPATDPVQDAVTGLRRVLAQGRADGLVTAKVVEELEKKASEAVEKFHEDDPEDAGDKLEDMRKELEEALEDGDVTTDLADELRARIDALDDAFAA